MRDCEDKEMIHKEILMGHLLSLYPADVAEFVYLRNPESPHQVHGQFLQS